MKYNHFRLDLRAKCLGWNGIICWVSGFGYSGFLSTSSLRTGTMEGATTGSGIMAASLARETSCESQLESTELGRITLLVQITEQKHLSSPVAYSHCVVITISDVLLEDHLGKAWMFSSSILVLQRHSWEWKHLFLFPNGTVFVISEWLLFLG